MYSKTRHTHTFKLLVCPKFEHNKLPPEKYTYHSCSICGIVRIKLYHKYRLESTTKYIYRLIYVKTNDKLFYSLEVELV